MNVGTSRPDPNEMTDFNLLTINGKVFPGTGPLVVKKGQRVRIRIGNLSAMDHHPIHLHGYQFRVTATDGGEIPESAQQLETTVLVPVGSTRTIEFVANEPGDWAMHCHMTHHVMNQMGHGLPNVIGVDARPARRQGAAHSARLHDAWAKAAWPTWAGWPWPRPKTASPCSAAAASTTPSRWAACSRS